jgi:hypothetical protein
LRREFQTLLTRNDPPPYHKTVKALLPDLKPAMSRATSTPSGQHALLLVGSPKAKPSTSAAVGGYLMQRLQENGWQVETMKLRARLQKPDGQHELLEAVERADLIVLSFPIYNDSLPYLVAYALQLIAARKPARANSKSQRLVAIANNGFPEPHHNLPAISICRRFAERCGFGWARGMAIGGGEALSAGQPLPEIKRKLPPVGHLMRALDLAAASLTEEGVVPTAAVRLIARNPIYPFPFSSYRWIFLRVAARRMEREAAENGVSPAMLRTRPY